MKIADKEIKFFWHDSSNEPISGFFDDIDDAVDWFDSEYTQNDWILGFISDPGEKLSREMVVKIARLINKAKKDYFKSRTYIN